MKRVLIFTFLLCLNQPLQIKAQSWVQKGGDIDGLSYWDYFGTAAAISGDGKTVVIGAPEQEPDGGYISVYSWTGETWTEKGRYIRGHDREGLGMSVSISADGNTIAAGAPFNSSIDTHTGRVRIFSWNGMAWVQKGASIFGEHSGDYSGKVSLDSAGNTVAIGAWGNDDTYGEAGQVRIFTWNGSAWVQKGMDIDGHSPHESSGTAVKISADGNTVVLGAPGNNSSDTRDGQVRVYHWNGSSWVQKGSELDGEAGGEQAFGHSVSISSDGNIIAIGAPGSSHSNGYGHVRVYGWNGSAWIQRGPDIVAEKTGNFYGHSVSLNADGNILAIGAPTYEYNDSSNSGYVRVFEWNGIEWIQIGSDITGESKGDQSGVDVSLSSDGRLIAIGANGDGGSKNLGYGYFVGHARVFSWVECMTDTTIDSVIACEAYTWTDGKIYTSSTTTAKQVFTDVQGCDSIVVLNLVVLDSNSNHIVKACESYTWLDGNTYTADNHTAIVSGLATTGCKNSTITLNLTILKSTASIDRVVSCGPYTWLDGQTYVANETEATYYLQNVAGCDSIVRLHLTVNDPISVACDSSSCALNIPNVITPNADGLNDVFQLPDLCVQGQDYGFLKIYNRWGQLIWSAKGKQGWDGYIQGNPATAGVYFYIYNRSGQQIKGSFYLIADH